MAFSLYQSSIPVYQRALPAFSAILDKAAAHAAEHKIDPAVLLASRLRPDMLPLSRQVQIFCDTAKNTAARLAGIEAPRIEDTEATIDELKARIQRTLDFIKTVLAKDIDAGEHKEIVFPVGPNKMKMKGADYLLHWSNPNFYFHLTTAYDILRYNGLTIGKRDYLAGAPAVPA